MRRWRHAGRQFLTLEKASSDTFAILESWTSEDPGPIAGEGRLSPEVVLDLLELLDAMKAGPREGLDKGTQGC